MIFCNGDFYRDEDFKVSPLNDGFMYGFGVYETLRTFDGKIFALKQHIDRLFHSASEIGIEAIYGKNDIFNFVCETKKRSSLKEARIKIVLTETFLIIIVSELILRPITWYQSGTEIVTYNIERILPDVKSMNSLPSVLAGKYAKNMRKYEAILIDREGMVREGSISNIFWIKSGKLYTTKTRILKGITREITLKISPKIIPVCEQDVFLKDVLNSDEVFITNTTSGILPVNKIDNTIIGNGKVGFYTEKLINLFNEEIKNPCYYQIC